MVKPDGVTMARHCIIMDEQAEDVSYGTLGQAQDRGLLRSIPTPGTTNLAPRRALPVQEKAGLLAGRSGHHGNHPSN